MTDAKLVRRRLEYLNSLLSDAHSALATEPLFVNVAIERIEMALQTIKEMQHD
jgi:hypothetical protein